MRLDGAAEAAPVHLVQIADEGAAVRVAHLERSDLDGLAAVERQRVFAHLRERLAGQHRDRGAVEAWPPDLGLEAETSLAQTFAQAVAFDARARREAHLLSRTESGVVQVCGG